MEGWNKSNEGSMEWGKKGEEGLMEWGNKNEKGWFELGSKGRRVGWNGGIKGRIGWLDEGGSTGQGSVKLCVGGNIFPPILILDSGIKYHPHQTISFIKL